MRSAEPKSYSLDGEIIGNRKSFIILSIKIYSNPVIVSCWQLLQGFQQQTTSKIRTYIFDDFFLQFKKGTLRGALRKRGFFLDLIRFWSNLHITCRIWSQIQWNKQIFRFLIFFSSYAILKKKMQFCDTTSKRDVAQSFYGREMIHPSTWS